MKNMSKLNTKLNQTSIISSGVLLTVAVIIGQVYIGMGYRLMTQSVNELTEVFTIIQEQDDLRRYGDRLY